MFNRDFTVKHKRHVDPTKFDEKVTKPLQRNDLEPDHQMKAANETKLEYLLVVGDTQNLMFEVTGHFGLRVTHSILLI